MNPALRDKDLVIVDRISYKVNGAERFDMVIFPYKYDNSRKLIKRVIGLPGETVQVKDGYVYIDGEKLDENYGLEVMEDAGIAAEPIELGEDEYFVLGDNRNHSSDSRDPSVGILHIDELIGRAWIRIWPLDSIGVIPHE